MGIAAHERQIMCDVFLAAGPDAPTLCEGWTVHDLTAHVWLREREPLTMPGFLSSFGAAHTERQMAAIKEKWAFGELVEKFRHGPSFPSLFALPGVDQLANVGEFYVHAEDVRRAAGLPEREVEPETQDALAGVLKTMGRAMFAKAPVGVVLVRNDIDQPERLIAHAGDDPVIITGPPSELLLFAFGRRKDAVVDILGDPHDVEDLLGK